MTTENEQVEVSGFGLKMRGPTKILLGVLTVVFTFVIVYLHDQKAEASSAKVLDAQAKLESRMVEMIYVLSLSQADREQLEISMPDSLRSRLGPPRDYAPRRPTNQRDAR